VTAPALFLGERQVSRHDQEFDFSAPPFNLLSTQEAARLGAKMDIEFMPRGTRMVEAGQGSNAVYVILKGEVAALDESESAGPYFAEYGEQDLFGTTAVLSGKARHTYEALEDTLVWTIPAEAFRAAVSGNGKFASYFLESLAKRSAEAEISAASSDLGEMTLTRTGDALLAEAVTVPEDCPLNETTRRMRDKDVDCVFVSGPEGLGIATRTDLLEAIALGHQALDDPVGQIASRPVIGCDVSDPLFHALVIMTRSGIERMAVFDEGSLQGTLGLAELLSHYSAHSHVIGLRAARAVSREELAGAAAQVNQLVRTLHATGGRMQYLAELVSAVNQRLMSRLFEFCFEESVREKTCLLVLGSEGRGEQLLKTDQDNALILDDAVDDASVQAGSQAFTDGLIKMGYPPCPGNVMVSNPEWRNSVSDWLQRIKGLVESTSPQAQMTTAILLDARVVAGNAQLFVPVRDALLKLGKNSLWMHHFVTPAVEFQTPLLMFSGLRGRSSGVDLKKGGIFPVVHGVRTLAVENGLHVTSTFDRIDELVDCGGLSERLGTDLRQAYSIMLRVRLGQQLEAVREGEVPGNTVRMSKLRRLDRDLLRDALRVVRDFQNFLSAHFRRGI
jgi:CBS domain-containing protein